MKRCVLALLSKKSFLLRFDHHFTSDMHCHHYTIFRSSQMGGIFGCQVITISIEGNDSSTVCLCHIRNIQVAHTLIGVTSWPWYSME